MSPSALTGPSSARERVTRRLAIERAWERYVKDDAEPQGLRAEIVASWRRCRQDYRIEPEQEAPRVSLSAEELALRREVDIVYRLARPILEDFADGLADHGLVYLDARGHMLSIDGDEAVVNALRGIKFQPGAVWNESSAGTNGPGTALAVGRPIEIFSSEHFVEAWHAWACAAAPVFVPGDEAPLALIDVTGRWERHSGQALHVAKAVACVIRERIVAARAVRAEVVRHAFRAARQTGDALAAVDTLGRVIAVNDAGARLGALSVGPIPPALRAALERGLFCRSAPARDEVQLELTTGRLCVATPVRFEETPVGAIVRVIGPHRPRSPAPSPRSSRAHWTFDAVLGDAPALHAAIDLARTASRNTLPVVISGESGTGKELFARAIHAEGPRGAGPFVAVNCAAIPATLIEAELFGYRDGAFTGARRGGAPGRFEDADGGTLFLDEVSELAPQAQAALLRVLQEREVVRVGGGAPLAVDVRVVAATNKPLAAEVKARRFRHDLYYRLNVLQVTIPPLRARSDDVVALAVAFLTEAAAELGRTGLDFTQDACLALRQYAWPGNVRELRNVVLRAAATAPGISITATDLDLEGPDGQHGSATPSAADRTLREAKLESERMQVLEALDASGWNVAQAAKRLDVSRMTLYRLLRRYGIERAN